MEINGKPLSGEQVALFQKLTKLQQGVAVGVLGGLSQREAYAQAGGKSVGSNADVAACNALRVPKVRLFVESFRADELERLADVVMSRDEMALTLTGMSRDRTEGSQSRLGAMKQLSSLLGYDKPVLVETNNTTRLSANMTLSAFYGELTSQEIADAIKDKPTDAHGMALMVAQLDKAGC